MTLAPEHRIYLDVCCLNRPFDDQTQDRIRLEAEAVFLILGHVQAGDWQWITSEAVSLEIGRTVDLERRGQVWSLAELAHIYVELGEAEHRRGRELEALGFADFDALHLACAESGS